MISLELLKYLSSWQCQETRASVEATVFLILKSTENIPPIDIERTVL